VTNSGYECVVKLYVLEYDENGRKIQDFDKKGREAVSTEKSIYHSIYPDIKDCVWTEELCQRHCLILPFFQEIALTDRESTLVKVEELYESKFLDNNYAIKEKDALWRHIGKIRDTLFIFDLCDVVSVNDGIDCEKLICILSQRRQTA